jgi:hypothetical protein
MIDAVSAGLAMHHRRTSLFALTCALALAACSDGHSHPYRTETPAPPADIALYGIDADQGMAQTPGQGAGAFIEYQSGGEWYVYLTCDSNRPGGVPCDWDIQVDLLGGWWSDLTAAELEPNDYLANEVWGPWLVAETTGDVDGFYFAAEPGATVSFDVLLDGQDGNGYVFWVSGGAVNPGAATNPVDLQPNQP